jgi:hypothetical protein
MIIHPPLHRKQCELIPEPPPRPWSTDSAQTRCQIGPRRGEDEALGCDMRADFEGRMLLWVEKGEGVVGAGVEGAGGELRLVNSISEG